MRENIKSIKKLPNYEKEVYSFDKSGKRFIKKVKVDDCYLVTMKNGSSVSLTKEQLSQYKVNCKLPDEINETITTEIEEDEDEVVTNTNNIVTVGSPNTVQIL